ncbi:uncharacterized protein K460DRAFT_365107 [Cucurbitaria berberidis CBS 394.84]|uniref:Uncharacterized protein n=1 Tax=Cucurbitaria berberidis CBS 394.84 TaxID=1168544 RepID=A0A9P4GPH7_9PLEO|nr:uncharacterized protein K460DRAFT_365107 [Cucurbitaria berberidis CBS 394.84]KAF1849194.1 hypothetical protein K460DRAFT_365107 [Cucurbitaria berberidis CBS 394.84]
MAGGQYINWLADVYRDTIIPYSKTWNQQFAAQIQTRLPPEVRDMIYHHLWNIDPRRSFPNTIARSQIRSSRDHTEFTWDSDTITLYPSLAGFARSTVRGDKNDIRQLCERSFLPHYICEEYVGPTTATEVVLSMYKAFGTAGFLLCQSHRIERVLTEDCFDVGLDPLSAIRQLTVHCKMDRYRTPPPKHPLFFGCNHKISELAYVRKKALKADFGPLLDVKKKSGFKLHILLIQRVVRIDVLAEFIETLSEIYEAFCKNGACVTVSWTYRGHWHPNQMIPDEDLVIKDITTFFDMPREVWAYNMSRFLQKVKRCILPRHWRIDWELTDSEIPANPSKFWISKMVHDMWYSSENEFTTDDEDDSDESGEDSADDDDNGSDVDGRAQSTLCP